MEWMELRDRIDGKDMRRLLYGDGVRRTNTIQEPSGHPYGAWTWRGWVDFCILGLCIVCCMDLVASILRRKGTSLAEMLRRKASLDTADVGKYVCQ